jgi:hypothetical protein
VNRTAVIGPFSVRSSSPSGSTALSVGVPGDTLNAAAGGTTFALTVQTSLQSASPDVAPASGGFQVTATDNSRVTATITNGVAGLAVDTNADGTVDGNLSVPWEFLD